MDFMAFLDVSLSPSDTLLRRVIFFKDRSEGERETSKNDF
jgi:hypothetical protein